MRWLAQAPGVAMEAGSSARTGDMGPGTGTGTGAVHMGESAFDTNMVIILGALLFALMCALGLNSALRCALRLGRRHDGEAGGGGGGGGGEGDGDGDVARVGNNTGLKRRVVRALPRECVRQGQQSDDCPICLGEFVQGDEVRILPVCAHRFHVHCVDTWLLSHSSCPTCRHSLLHLPLLSTQAQAQAQSQSQVQRPPRTRAGPVSAAVQP